MSMEEDLGVVSLMFVLCVFFFFLQQVRTGGVVLVMEGVGASLFCLTWVLCWCVCVCLFVLSDAQLKKLAEEREEAAELRSMAKRDAAKEYAVKLDANEKKLKQVRCQATR